MARIRPRATSHLLLAQRSRSVGRSVGRSVHLGPDTGVRVEATVVMVSDNSNGGNDIVIAAIIIFISNIKEMAKIERKHRRGGDDGKNEAWAHRGR